MKKIIKENWSYIFVGILLIIWSIFLCCYKENMVISVLDMLDSHIAWLKMIKDNNLFFDMKGIVPYLGGISRMYLYSPLKPVIWLYEVMPVFYAYNIMLIIKTIIAVAGFVFLGKVIDKNFEKNKHIFILCGFLFGIAPYYPISSFDFASLPFILGLLILYYKTKNNKYLPFFFLYPIFSNFFMFGFAIIGYTIIYLIIDFIKNKKIAWYMIKPIIMLTMGYFIVEFNIFYSLLFSNEPSLRVEFTNALYDLGTCKKMFFTAFTKGHYQSASLHNCVVLPVCLIYLLYSNFFLIKEKRYRNILYSPFNLIMVLILLNAFFHGADYYEPFKKIMEIIPVFKGFSFARTLWLNPFLWYFAFAIALINMPKLKNIRYLIILSGLIYLCFGTTDNCDYNQIRDNIRSVTYRIKSKPQKYMSYKEFYSEKLFDKIKKDIDYKGEWACAFAMHPAVIEYNGIKTLDGYLSYYPLSYKHKFREIIAPQLEYDKKQAEYFDNFGGRAYLYSTEAQFTPVLKFKIEETPLRINTEAFKNIGGVYIFSRIKISNYNELGFDFINKYTHDKSLYNIYVYKIKL